MRGLKVPGGQAAGEKEPLSQ
jgi:hypothetical protein